MKSILSFYDYDSGVLFSCMAMNLRLCCFFICYLPLNINQIPVFITYHSIAIVNALKIGMAI